MDPYRFTVYGSGGGSDFLFYVDLDPGWLTVATACSFFLFVVAPIGWVRKVPCCVLPDFVALR